MKINLACGLSGLLVCVVSAVANGIVADAPAPLRVAEQGRCLVTADGRGVFLLADTAWSLVNQLKRDDLTFYLQQRRAQGFNAITFVLYATGDANQADAGQNAYGCAPFALTHGRPDPTRPLVTPGDRPERGADYDYWDHTAFAIAEAKRLGLYLLILPCWGSAVAGGYRGEPSRDIIFDTANARSYGRWLAARFRDEPHILWMLGGDRSAAYAAQPDRDYRSVFRAMAAGLVEGGGERPALMSFHPQKGGASQARANPQSSTWFHQDGWLAFNSIQLWPEHQPEALARDWQLAPPKPTWVFEPRYEGYWKKPYTAADWGEWPTRLQAYQSVFAGGFGFTYGHERVFGFGKDGWDWKQALAAPGASQMQPLARLMAQWSPAEWPARRPAPDLLAGEAGTARRLTSNLLSATRHERGTLAMIYSANGRAMTVRMSKLHGPTMRACWFNPRTGKWRGEQAETDEPKPFVAACNAGIGAADQTFMPPGGEKDGNDWVLVLRSL